MKKLVLLLGLPLSVWATESRVLFKDDQGITHFEQVRTLSADEVAAKAACLNFRPLDGGSEEVVMVEQIINLGKKIWQIIEENHPVVNVSYSYANALPKGLKDSEDLDSFSDLQFHSVRQYGTNLFGMTVYDVTYTTVHRYGGSYNGVGKYLENVTVLPEHVEAVWGYTVDLKVTHVGTVNVGTKAAPVSALSMELDFRVKTAVKEIQVRRLFDFRGDRATVVNKIL